MTDRSRQHRPRSPLVLFAVLLGLGAATAGCGREMVDPAVGDGEGAGDGVIRSVTVEVPVGVRWVNSGIRLHEGEILRIRASTPSGREPSGRPVPHPDAPVRLYGVDGLIGRIGETGFPFPLDDRRRLQGSSLYDGETLYVGRNVAPPDPFVDEVTDSSSGEQTGQTELASIPYTAEPYTVAIEVRRTDAPALLSPVHGFYDSNPNPVFDWDEIDNASQYKLEISDFPDFRRVLFSININTTSVNTAAVGIDPNDPTNVNQGPNLTEGVYWWRVRAQINRGEIFTPELIWTDRSAVFRLGVETRQDLPDPELITPSGPLQVQAGSVLPFEILAERDASGLEWRYAFYHGPCGDLIAPEEATPRLRSPWMVFQHTRQTNDISSPRHLYGSFASPSLKEGEWLLRVETRDGVATSDERNGELEYEFTAGCQ